MGTQTFYLSSLIKEVGFDKATEKATELRAKGYNVIVDAESIIDRNGDDAWDMLDGLKKKGYGIKINQATLDRMFNDKSSQASDLATKRGWHIYSQPDPAQKAQMAQTLQEAHLPEQERTAMFASMLESPHQTPLPYQGPTMRAATAQEQQAMLKTPTPASPKSSEEMNAEWAARRGLVPSMIDPATYVKPRPEAQTIPERAAERVLDVAMQPVAAGMRSVLLPQRYWESAKALSNVLSNSTGQAANALGLGNYKYSDWYKSKSKSLDEDIGNVLGPIEDVTTVLWRDPIVALGVLGASTRTIADMSVTPFSSEQTGAKVAGATLKEAPLTAAIVDPVGSAFESVGDVAAKAYEAAGGTPGTADKLRGLGTVAMLAAFSMASSRRIEAIRKKVEKGEKLTAEEQKVVDTVAPDAPMDKVQQSLQELELNAKTNAEVLDKAKENKIVTQAVEPQQQIQLSPEVQSAEAIAGSKPAKTLADMTQAEFADWLVKNDKSEDVYSKLTLRPELRDTNNNFTMLEQKTGIGIKQIKEKSKELEKIWKDIADGITKVNDGIKAIVGDWQNFSINKGTGSPEVTPKSYVTLADPMSLNSADTVGFLNELQSAGFNGQVKLPPAGSALAYRFDNIVIHGRTLADAKLAGDIAGRYFGDRVQRIGFGQDMKVGGRSRSHTDLLAESVLNRRKGLPTPEIKPQEVPVAESLRENAGQIPPGRDVAQGREVQGGENLQRQAQVPPGNAPEQVKQPWEMTKDEYVAEATRQLEDAKPIRYDLIEKEVVDKKTGEKRTNKKYVPIPNKADTNFIETVNRFHKLQIEKSISEGKPVPPEVLAEYPDLAKQQVAPSAETQPPKQMMGIADPIGAAVQAVKQATQPPPRPDLTEKPRSLYEEPEQYFEQNKGIQINEPSLWAKVKDFVTRHKQGFARSRPNIDPRASVPETVTQETLRRYQDAPERAQVNAVDTIYKFTSELGPDRKDLLYRVVMLEDLAKDLESGLTDISEKPLGYDSAEKVNSDLQQFRAKMLSDPKTADAYGKRQQLFRPIVEALVDGDRLPEEALDDPRYYHHQILEHYTEGGKQLGSKDLRLYKKGFERQRTGSAKALNTEGVESDFEWLSGAYYQLHTLEAQGKIKQAADKSMELGVARDVIKEATGVDPGIQIPEGYVEWQVPPNHPFFKATTLPERIINEVMNEGAAVVEPGDLRQLTAVGKGETWIIPENIAKELNDIGHRNKTNIVGDLARGINNAWKRWVILNPWRATKYMLNNLTGDLDAIISIAPGTMRFAPKFTVNLWNKVWKNQATPEFQKLYDEWLSKSILQSGLTLEEIPDVKKLPALRLLQATMNDKSPFWKRPDKMVSAAFDTYWQNTNLLNIWRESVLRVSAYEYWKERVNKSGKRQYGASDRATIDQMYDAVKEGKLDLNDVAARLARDTLGDYGNISQTGQWMRKTTHPFWSWVEINVPRYYHLFKNIAAEGKGTDLAGASAYGGARLAGKAAWRAAKVYAFSQAFFAAVNLHNKTVYPEEDKLINKAKGELYLITPFKNDDGSRRVVRFSGALSDALSMFGLRDYLRDVPELIQGKQKAKDAAWQVLSSMPEQLWQRMTPFVKGAAEIGLQRQTYPRLLREDWPEDVTSIRDMLTTGRPVRSDWKQIWKYAAMDWLYNAYRRGTGRPFPQRDAALADLISTSVDTNQAAYYAIREKTYDFLKERGEENPPPSKYKDKANAAYFFKVASQIDDKDAARYWFKEYMRLSKDDYAKQLASGKGKNDFITYSLDNLNKSIEASSPLGALSDSGQEAAFIRSLSPEDKEMLNAAMRWYHSKLPHKPKK